MREVCVVTLRRRSLRLSHSCSSWNALIILPYFNRWMPDSPQSGPQRAHRTAARLIDRSTTPIFTPALCSDTAAGLHSSPQLKAAIDATQCSTMFDCDAWWRTMLSMLVWRFTRATRREGPPFFTSMVPLSKRTSCRALRIPRRR